MQGSLFKVGDIVTDRVGVVMPETYRIHDITYDPEIRSFRYRIVFSDGRVSSVWFIEDAFRKTDKPKRTKSGFSSFVKEKGL